MTKYILASASPRRKELLARLGLTFEVRVSDCEEIITQTEPEKVVEELSFQKAWDVAEKVKAENKKIQAVIIGADTVVAYDGRILGKPGSGQEAEEMLAMLAGNTHQVYTGVTLAVLAGEDNSLQSENREKESVTFHECTRVTFAPMTEAEIREYVRTGEPMDKAGAYGIQGQCAKFVRSIEGDYYNVVGLPLCRLYEKIKELHESSENFDGERQ